MKNSAYKKDNSDSIYYNSVEDIKSYAAKINEERKKRDSFASQEVDVHKYVFSPEGWENFVLICYIILIPYIVGVLFLFVFIAEVAFEKFLLLDMSSIIIVWAIGYEVIAATLLFGIFVSFLSYLIQSKSTTQANNPYKARR
ncbi:MAG TPA: hypothetical protein CFH84_06350 [Sulfurimonas sp. UBA12504]|nr:MAG: hypothetical protein A2019_02695 [Sulfurimonas sp. GWF2_37_8]DAB30019.1 MAG TPA: hypothetical protein CFH84_06350 [Sulfurimonas sp. UBA12504]